MHRLVIALSLMVIGLFINGSARAEATNLLHNPGFESESYTFVARDPNDPLTTFNAPFYWWGGFILTPHTEPWMNVAANGYPHTGPIKHSGNRSFNIARGGGTFTAYVYQQVDVMPNTDIQGGSWVYIENDTNSQARAGIDPLGGSDPYSPNVVWSDWTGRHYRWVQVNVGTRTKGSRATLFLFTTQTKPTLRNGVYWDDAFLNGEAGQPAAPSAANPATPTGSVTAKIQVYVRRGPGQNFPRIGKINPGETFALVEESGDWYKIDFNGQPGFVSKQYAELSGAAPQAPAATTIPTTTGASPSVSALKFTANYLLRLRSQPNASAETIATVPYKTVLQAIGRSTDNRWLQVTFNNQTGWAAARLGQLDGKISSLPIKE